MEFEYIEHRKGLPYKLFLVSIGHRLHHFHSDMEIIYCLSGGVNIGIGHEQFRLSAGDLFVIHPYEMHQINQSQSDDINILLIIQLTPKAFHYSNHILSRLRFHSHFLNNRDHFISKLMSKMYVDSFDHNDSTEYWLNAYILSMLGRIIQTESYDLSDKASIHLSDDYKRIQFVISYVENHFQEKIKLDDIANALHISKYYLSHLISAKMGQNFQEYVNRVRFTHALNLIVNSNESILDISMQSGFSDVKYLNAQMKKTYGKTANQVRKLASSLFFATPNAPVGSVHLPINQEYWLEKLKSDYQNSKIVI